MINPQFVEQIAANIKYWQQVTVTLSDETLTRIDKEKHNLFRAVYFGLVPDKTVSITLNLILTLFPLIERRGYWHEWLPILVQAINCCPPNNTQLKIRLLNQLGFLHQLIRDFPQAITVLEKAVKLAQLEDDGEALATAYFYLGNVYYDDAQYPRAAHYIQKAQVAFAKSGLLTQNVKQAAIHNLLGLIAQSQGNHQEAIVSFKEAVYHWHQTDQHIYLCRTWNNLGLSYLALKKFSEALDCFQEAESALGSILSEDERVRIAINQGQAYYEQKKWELAERSFRQAEKRLLEQKGSLSHKALINNNLAAVLLERNHFEEARIYGQKSLAMWDSLGNKLMVANVWGMLGEIDEAQGDSFSACENYKKSLDRFASFQDNEWARQRQKELSLRWTQLNKKELAN